jgi:tRNA threonylcarbamoyladenosine biosynthesis protein TsaE
VIRTTSASETRAIGHRLGLLLRAGDIITLSGPFGAGKTTLVQGVGEALGIEEPLASPSFQLVHEYLPDQSGARLPFFHLDLYRIGDGAEALDLCIDDYIARGGALAIEWPAAAEPVLPADRLSLELQLEGDGRLVSVGAGGARGRELAARLEEATRC